MGFGLRGEMLAGAEADLEPELVGWNRKEPLRMEAAALRELDAQLRQQAREQVALAGTQSPPAASAVEDPAPGIGARLRRVPQAKAERSCGIRSRRSQEKPPSDSGCRPKWP